MYLFEKFQLNRTSSFCCDLLTNIYHLILKYQIAYFKNVFLTHAKLHIKQQKRFINLCNLQQEMEYILFVAVLAPKDKLRL